MNSIALGGRLVRDTELRATSGGMSICNFSVAVNENRKKKDGSFEKKCHFFEAVAFGKTAETINKCFSKGDYILLNGKLQQEQWEDKDGNKKSKVSVVVDQIHFTGERTAGNASNGGGSEQQGDRPQQPPTNTHLSDDDDDSIPF